MATRRDISSILWRVVALWSLMFWQGGFLFYASVVVPMAQGEIGHFQQGFITRHVTEWLNIAAAVSLTLLAIDLVAGSDSPGRRRWLWVGWAAMAACQGVLFFLHPRMDALLDAETLRIGARADFTILHRVYLWVHAVQWAVAVAFTAAWACRWRNVV